MNNKGKTLVVLSPAFPANESESYWVPSQQLLVKTLQKNFPGWNIRVLSFIYPYAVSDYNWQGIPVSSFHGSRYKKWNRLLLWWKIWRKLKGIRRRENLAGILSFWCKECALVGSYFGKSHGIPHHTWICGQDARITNHYVKFFRPKPAELVAISDFAAAEFYRNHGIKPQYIIPNAIDENSFPSIPHQTRDIDLLGVGALIPLKQFDILVNLTKQLKEQFPTIGVVICGKGEEKDNLQALITKQGLETNIRLTGALPREQVLELMQRTKLLVHPSSYEGFSTVCLEALYAGARVISFTKPMNQKIRNWHIVRDKAEMKDKVLELLKPGRAEYEPVLVFSMNETANKMMQLFTAGPDQ
jgi:glycosyltransferase involved in cell wall biosynthesis